MDQGWLAKESFVVGEVPNARGAYPDKLDPFTVAFLAACQGIAELIGNEGVTQLVRSIHAEPRQATALLTSMLRLGMPGTCDGLVKRIIEEEVQLRKNMNEPDLNRRVPTMFDKPKVFVEDGKRLAVHIFAD